MQISIIGKLNKFFNILTFQHKKPARKNHPDTAGFTLMELIVVCILLSAFLTLAVPALRNTLYVDELGTSARKIVGAVQELRHLAVREHKAYLLHFDLDANRIWHEPDGTLDPFAEEPKNGLTLPDGISFRSVVSHSESVGSSGKKTLWISQRGYMDQTFVHLSDSSGNTLTLLFSPFSGSARVYDGYVEDI
ncbi:MAG: hypothetical protein V2I36_15325 [Desulfopila sp.]|nr:hypothetical protein [Desulfopila sp.]